MDKILATIRTLRTKSGKTQKEMAALLGYSEYSGYAKIEKGETELTVRHLLKISDVLKIPVTQLLGISDFDHIKPSKVRKVSIQFEIDEKDELKLLEKYLK